MSFTLSVLNKSRILRIVVAPWLLIGHGIPKLSHWLFGIETWGPHLNYVPTNVFSATAAIIEFVCPILILVGFKVRISSAVVALMLLLSGFTKPFPVFMERVLCEGERIPLAVIISQEIIVAVAIGYVALALFGKDEPFFSKSSKID